MLRDSDRLSIACHARSARIRRARSARSGQVIACRARVSERAMSATLRVISVDGRVLPRGRLSRQFCFVAGQLWGGAGCFLV